MSALFALRHGAGVEAGRHPEHDAIEGDLDDLDDDLKPWLERTSKTCPGCGCSTIGADLVCVVCGARKHRHCTLPHNASKCANALHIASRSVTHHESPTIVRAESLAFLSVFACGPSMGSQTCDGDLSLPSWAAAILQAGPALPRRSSGASRRERADPNTSRRGATPGVWGHCRCNGSRLRAPTSSCPWQVGTSSASPSRASATPACSSASMRPTVALIGRRRSARQPEAFLLVSRDCTHTEERNVIP